MWQQACRVGQTIEGHQVGVIGRLGQAQKARAGHVGHLACALAGQVPADDVLGKAKRPGLCVNPGPVRLDPGQKHRRLRRPWPLQADRMQGGPCALV